MTRIKVDQLLLVLAGLAEDHERAFHQFVDVWLGAILGQREDHVGELGARGFEGRAVAYFSLRVPRPICLASCERAAA